MPAESVRSTRPAWLLPVAVVAAAAILIALVFSMDRGGGPTAERGPGAAEQEAPAEVEGPSEQYFIDAERRDEGDLLASGPVDAPVVLVVFSDYQCPFCSKWNNETLPLMMEHVEAGELRIEWRDVNVFGPASERAARASYAAAQQGAFWEYHDALFPDGDTRSERELGEDALISLAGDLGLDTELFSDDLASDETAAQIAANEQFGLELGAYSTPAFILGGQVIVGAQPSQVFLDTFEYALNAAG